ncbi:MAG: hypothetical protein KTR14_07165 [Vampirovibrio sp.]|nr:hypothetical protein [Vampirovibrio sp.]
MTGLAPLQATQQLVSQGQQALNQGLTVAEQATQQAFSQGVTAAEHAAHDASVQWKSIPSPQRQAVLDSAPQEIAAAYLANNQALGKFGPAAAFMLDPRASMVAWGMTPHPQNPALSKAWQFAMGDAEQLQQLMRARQRQQAQQTSAPGTLNYHA